MEMFPSSVYASARLHYDLPILYCKDRFMNHAILHIILKIWHTPWNWANFSSGGYLTGQNKVIR